MTDTSHLAALYTRLSHEREYLAADGAEIRKVWITQIEKEIADEKNFLGMDDTKIEMSDDELLAALEA